MEDLSSARQAEHTELSPLQAEWLSSQRSSEKFELAAAKSGVAGNGPGKDVADRLDRELRQFANSQIDGASAGMKEFQKLVGNFEDAADKKAAIKDFEPAYAKLKASMEKDTRETFKKMEAEAAKVPGRKALDADLSAKTNKFFDQASKLPSKDYERVLGLMEWKDGDSFETRNARVRDGIKNSPRLLKSFNDMETAREKVEQSKTPLEKQLDEQYRRDISEAKTIKAIVNKAVIRSEINDNEIKEQAEKNA